MVFGWMICATLLFVRKGLISSFSVILRTQHSHLFMCCGGEGTEASPSVLPPQTGERERERGEGKPERWQNGSKEKNKKRKNRRMINEETNGGAGVKSENRKGKG